MQSGDEMFVSQFTKQLVGSVITVCENQAPHTTLRLLVTGQVGLEIAGVPVDKNNVRELRRKVLINMQDYYLKEVEDAAVL